MDVAQNFKNRLATLDVLKHGLVNGTCLEIGAGKRFYTVFMEDWGYEVFPTDITRSGEGYYDITGGHLPSKFENVISIGVLHHIIENDRFINALENIKKMAIKRIILGVKITSPKINIARRRPQSVYLEMFGDPIIVKNCNYLTMLVFDIDNKN